FSNDDAVANAILAAGPKTDENVWRMPLPEQYDRMIDSPAADVKNASGRAAGSITAALFLQRFVNKTPWAHIDIAPTAWVKDSKRSTVPDGATGCGVRLLDRMVADAYEAGRERAGAARGAVRLLAVDFRDVKPRRFQRAASIGADPNVVLAGLGPTEV